MTFSLALKEDLIKPVSISEALKICNILATQFFLYRPIEYSLCEIEFSCVVFNKKELKLEFITEEIWWPHLLFTQ